MFLHIRNRTHLYWYYYSMTQNTLYDETRSPINNHMKSNKPGYEEICKLVSILLNELYSKMSSQCKYLKTFDVFKWRYKLNHSIYVMVVGL